MRRQLRRSASATLLLLAFALLPLSACDGLFGPDPGDEGPIESLPRSLTDAEQRTIEASNRFGFRLLGELHAEQSEENHFISPLSASMALGMALNGADGRTFEAIRSTLGFPETDLAAVNESYAGLIELLQGLDPRVEFLLANSVWLQPEWPFLPEYVDRVTDAFDARVEMPRFELEYEAMLNRALERMGMGPAFSTDSADFSRMAETPPCTSGTRACTSSG